MRFLLLACLVSASAFAQTPNALVQFPDPPEDNGAPATVYNRHLLWNSGKTCVQRPVGSTWECLATGAEVASTYATQADVDAADTVIHNRIDAVEASIPVISEVMVCGTASISGLSIPLTGISSATNITATGATVGAPCVVGGSSFLPLGAYGVCVVSAPNTISLRFQGGGLLSSLIAIPNGTYKACALVAP